MDKEIKLFVYPVKDLAKAKALFSQLLGVAPYMDEAYYVGFKVGDQEIGLDPNGHSRGAPGQSPTGTLAISSKACKPS